jgi:hypothetical protein
MKKVSVLLLVITTIFMVSCTDAGQEKLFNYGNEFKVEMYSGGQLVRTWVSTGKVKSEEGSDGYYFKDKATGKLVEVAGDIVITNND